MMRLSANWKRPSRTRGTGRSLGTRVGSCYKLLQLTKNQRGVCNMLPRYICNRWLAPAFAGPCSTRTTLTSFYFARFWLPPGSRRGNCKRNYSANSQPASTTQSARMPRAKEDGQKKKQPAVARPSSRCVDSRHLMPKARRIRPNLDHCRSIRFMFERHRC